MIEQKRVFDPERVKLGRALRKDRSPLMRRRRIAVGLSLASTATLGFISLFQTGIIRKLPDPPIKRFKASAVSSSGEGYLMGIPDALLGMVSYTVTASLIAGGPPDRVRKLPWLPAAAMVKTGLDTIVSLRLARIQFRDLRLYCVYCLAATGMTVAAAPLTWGEGVKAVRSLVAADEERHQALPPVPEEFRSRAA